MNLIDKAVGTFQKVKGNWTQPPQGYSVNYKEITAYSVGGIGVNFALHLASLIVLAVDNTIICHVIGIVHEHIAIMNIFVTIACFGLTAFRAHAFDNIKSSEGKFRPFVKRMGLPTVIVSLAMVWMPYDRMEYRTKIIIVFILYVALQFFMPFYKEAYQNITRVISTNSQERTNILSISSIVWSLAPTICNAIVPMLSDFTGGMYDIRTYRYIFPILSVAGVFIGHIAYKGTRERTVQSKQHTVGVGFFEAFRTVAKNKYFWVITLASWIGFLESAQANILSWQFQYSQNSWAGNWTMYGILTTILGNASLWGMMFAPMLVKRFGKRAVLIGINFSNIIFLACLYNTFDNLGVMVSFIWLNNLAGSVTVVLTPAIDADIRDYQHYLTGQRIDGVFSLITYISSVVNLVTGLVLPQIYKSVGYYGDVSVLYDSTIRNNLLSVLVIASVIGATCNLIPYFFYDFTEVKQKGVVAVIRMRAIFEDYKNGEYDEKELEEIKELIKEAFENRNKERFSISKDGIKQAKKLPKSERKQAIKEKRKELAFNKEENKKLDVYDFLCDELTMYRTDEKQQELQQAKQIVSAGVFECLTYEFAERTGIEKMKKYVSLAQKHYPDGIKKFDRSRIELVENLPQGTKEELEYKKRMIKEVRKEQSKYNRVARLYIEAERIVARAEAYEEILTLIQSEMRA